MDSNHNTRKTVYNQQFNKRVFDPASAKKIENAFWTNHTKKQRD